MPTVRTESRARKDFCQRIRWIMAQHPEIPQAEWARRLGVYSSTIGDILNKQRLPNGEILLKMAGVFDVDGHWLITGEGTPSPKSGGAERAFKVGGSTALTSALEALEALRVEWEGTADRRDAREAGLAVPRATKRRRA